MSACKEFIAAVDKVKALYERKAKQSQYHWLDGVDVFGRAIKEAEQEVKIALKRMMEE